MNCRELHADIGLYVECDLPWHRIEQIEKHLTECRTCRVFADELQQSQSELRQLRNEIVDSSALQRIRDGVLAEVQAIEDQRTWLDRAAIRLWAAFRLRYVVTACLVLGVAGATIWQWRHPGDIATPPVRVAGSVAPASYALIESLPIQREAQPVVARRVTHKSVRAKPRPKVSPLEDLVVQIQTDDPNIIIYWLIDQKTGGE
jgi:anti-sigma factor RsiW